MSDFRYVVEIRDSPAHVWSVLMDVNHWHEWTTSVTRVQRLEIGPLTLGSRTRIWQPKLMPAIWCVTSLDAARHYFAWTTHTFGMKIVAGHLIEPIEDSTEPSAAHCRLTLTLQYSGLIGILMARIYRNITWDYISREGNGLRKRCEEQTQPVAATR
jgi:hypothetical protein